MNNKMLTLYFITAAFQLINQLNCAQFEYDQNRANSIFGQEVYNPKMTPYIQNGTQISDKMAFFGIFQGASSAESLHVARNVLNTIGEEISFESSGFRSINEEELAKVQPPNIFDIKTPDKQRQIDKKELLEFNSQKDKYKEANQNIARNYRKITNEAIISSFQNIPQKGEFNTIIALLNREFDPLNNTLHIAWNGDFKAMIINKDGSLESLSSKGIFSEARKKGVPSQDFSASTLSAYKKLIDSKKLPITDIRTFDIDPTKNHFLVLMANHSKGLSEIEAFRLIARILTNKANENKSKDQIAKQYLDSLQTSSPEKQNLSIIIVDLKNLLGEESIESKFWNAIRLGNSGEVQLLIKENPKMIDSRDARGNTPLIYAVLSSDAILVKTLLDLGANRDLQSPKGQTALDLASKIERKEANKEMSELLTSKKYETNLIPIQINRKVKKTVRFV